VKDVSRDKLRGRPRDETARRALLDAAYELVVERGYAAVSMDAIAAKAGSGKQTIYRWWPGKADLVLDALEDWAETEITKMLEMLHGIQRKLGINKPDEELEEMKESLDLGELHKNLGESNDNE